MRGYVADSAKKGKPLSPRDEVCIGSNGQNVAVYCRLNPKRLARRVPD
jgi:hypothetical protein